MKKSYQAKVEIIEFIYPFLSTLKETITEKNSTQRSKINSQNQLHFSLSEFELLENQLISVSKLVAEVSSEETTNVDKWIHLVRLIRSCIDLFKYKKTIFRKFYEVDKSSLIKYIEDIKYYIADENLDPLKNSWEYLEAFRNTPLEVRLREDLEEHNHFIDSELNIDYSKFTDYILYSFDAIGSWFHITGISDSLHNYLEKHDLDLGYADVIYDQIPSEDLSEDMIAEDLPIGLEAIETIYDPIKLSTKYLETFEFDLSEIIINVDKSHYIKQFQKEISNSSFNYFILNETVRLDTSISGHLFVNEEITIDNLRENLKISATRNELYYQIAYKNTESEFIMYSTVGGYDEKTTLTKKQLLSIKL
jgi:hypothetical protein